jgi:hypothetical protein
MWSEICELIPLTTGLDSCIEHDIREYESCIKTNEIKGNKDVANLYEKQLNKLRKRKKELDNMNPIARWWHCKIQFRKELKRYDKVIKELQKQRR